MQLTGAVNVCMFCDEAGCQCTGTDDLEVT